MCAETRGDAKTLSLECEPLTLSSARAELANRARLRSEGDEEGEATTRPPESTEEDEIFERWLLWKLNEAEDDEGTRRREPPKLLGAAIVGRTLA